MSFSEKSLITVLLPVVDERYLATTLKSIDEQSLPGEIFNLLVINDGMAKESIEKVVSAAYSKSNVKIVESSKHGIVGALNTGLSQSTTKYIARIDQDDVMMRDRLKIQLQYLEANKQVLCVGGQLQLIDYIGESIGFSYYPKSNWLINKTSKLSSPMAHPAVMFRRDDVEALGGYREGVPEDWDLWLRLLERGRVANVEQIVIKYRIHRNQLSRTKLYQSEFARKLITISNNLREIGLKDCPEVGEDSINWVERNILFWQPVSKYWELHLWSALKKINSQALRLKYLVKRDY